ncbi:TBC domain-containing [Hyphodiscus hymeniophilus]|uniref:TBC domain-containing n=1 Tax=Hyphodiscus hymeniophilus TaxID=353542 RepID=A0A9P6SLA8_9HELO|nr:TBC domain-containing [Hyphodiscus hymeniophilus]
MLPAQTSLRTKSMGTTSPNTRSDEGLITLRYEEAAPAKAPIAVTVAPPRAPPTDTHPALRREIPEELVEAEERKRDSGLAPTTSSKARDSSLNTGDGKEKEEGALGGLKVEFESSIPATPKIKKSDSVASSRGPRVVGGNLVREMGVCRNHRRARKWRVRLRRTSPLSRRQSRRILFLSDDLEEESKKVRSMYEADYDWNDGRFSSLGDHMHPEQEPAAEMPESSKHLLSPTLNGTTERPVSALSTRSEGGTRKPHELAGGIEDWEDVEGKDVDRYGFISASKSPSRPGTPEPRPPQRVSTVLQLASEAPRKRRAFGRSPSVATSRIGFRRPPGRKASARSLRTQDTRRSTSSNRSNSLRAAANRLPGNQDRRWMDEAGDMLTLPPGLADIAEDEEGGRAAEALKKKEWDRAEKWRKMAKIVKVGKDGEGMEFEFDTGNPKLIERTWKGIPDRWRAAAWYSFLGASARKRNNSPTQEDIIGAFHKLQSQSSADDVQIDIDVPRTINSHIMFRRRYRGGQRLLFRVLHALSLYFPDTGYVQGMASLAATLLCYYDEERTFVMLARMWTLRGLDKLYEAGFPGLMAALNEFQKQWLGGGEVSKKLADLNIEPTAYGTRWYLTIFNYSIPFPAQLRVWDVFMLLGDPDLTLPLNKDRPFAGGLDILHATSAALIDGTREILLDSDFENAMKVLTSWIPVKDEELLMKVTKAEWKLKRGKRKH